MAFDECPSSRADRAYVQASVESTTRWLVRCKQEMERLNGLEDTLNREMLLFGINQGAVFADIRGNMPDRLRSFTLNGYASRTRRE